MADHCKYVINGALKRNKKIFRELKKIRFYLRQTVLYKEEMKFNEYSNVKEKCLFTFCRSFKSTENGKIIEQRNKVVIKKHPRPYKPV